MRGVYFDCSRCGVTGLFGDADGGNGLGINEVKSMDFVAWILNELGVVRRFDRVNGFASVKDAEGSQS